MEIVDTPEVKPWWQSKANWGQIGLAIGLFLPQKYKDLVGPTVESLYDVSMMLLTIYGRWHAGGVHIPLIGAKEK